MLGCFALSPDGASGRPAAGRRLSRSATPLKGNNALSASPPALTIQQLVGFRSSSNTKGSFNTAIGAGALLVNTGDENTAIGAGALLSNTTGVTNTANGVQALFSNTTGNNNTANGVQALFSNTTGIDNTANGASRSLATPPAATTRPTVLCAL